MTPERWKIVEVLFEGALGLRKQERAKFFQQHCNGDEELRREVESLLDSHADAGTLLETPAGLLGETLANFGARLAAGELIGHYRIVRELGRGGMGSVYLAERAGDYEQRVAIKLIKRGMDTDAVVRHFRNERQILASFDHPNIGRLFDGGTTADGLPYFVMEYIDGIPIDKYCDEQQLTIRERLKLFREVCAAVTYAHRHTVIHRDIKPSNILVTSDGVPKLLDFGIAKILLAGDGAQTFVTIAGARPMTPEYASPEQIRGDPVTTATDVYSLGVVLFQLLTGQLPYHLTTRSPREIEQAITDQEPIRPSTVVASASSRSSAGWKPVPQLRGDLDNIVLMALRKEAARRYQSVEQFSEDIRRYLENRPVLARSDTIGYRTKKFVQRNRVATAAALLILVSLITGLIATTWEAHQARLEKTRAEHRFNDVRRLAHSVLFDYHDAIKDLPGATRVRERLVKDALTYLDSLAREAVGDPALQRELAAAYERVGDVRGQPFSASLGDVPGAIDSYFKAMRIREALVASRPRDVQSRRELAANYLRTGTELIHTNDAVRGTDYLGKALSIYRQLNAEQPSNPEIRYDLAATYNELGHALEDWWGKPAEALEHHRKALSIREQFAAADPHSEKYQRDLSMTYVNIGRAFALSGDPEQGLENNRKGLLIREQLFARNPNNSDYRRLLAISYQHDGTYRARLDDLNGALQSLRKKLALDEQSVADDPANAQAGEDLGFSYELIGELSGEAGDHVQALSYYRKALAMYEKVSATTPQLLRIHYRIIFAHTGIAEMEANLGERADALAECSKASTLLNEVPQDPNLTWQRTMKGNLYVRLGDAYGALANFSNLPTTEQRTYWGAARSMFVRSLEVWQDLQKRGALTGANARIPQKVEHEIAECDTALKSIQVSSR